MARAALAAPGHRSDAKCRRRVGQQRDVGGEEAWQGRRRLSCQRVAQVERKVGHHEGEGGMAVAAMTTVVAMRYRLIVQKIETIIVVLVLVEIMTMAVCRRGVEMPMQCVLRRPDCLERHEPHQKNQESTTHGAR